MPCTCVRVSTWTAPSPPSLLPVSAIRGCHWLWGPGLLCSVHLHRGHPHADSSCTHALGRLGMNVAVQTVERCVEDEPCQAGVAWPGPGSRHACPRPWDTSAAQRDAQTQRREGITLAAVGSGLLQEGLRGPRSTEPLVAWPCVHGAFTVDISPGLEQPLRAPPHCPRTRPSLACRPQ